MKETWKNIKGHGDKKGGMMTIYQRAGLIFVLIGLIALNLLNLKGDDTLWSGACLLIACLGGILFIVDGE